MGYYEDALEWHGTAIDLSKCGRFRASVYMSCLAGIGYNAIFTELVDIYRNNMEIKE